jgi:hypothetical protein
VGAAISGFAMVRTPVGGAVEVAAIVVFGTYFLIAIGVGWWRARQWRLTEHRAWMIRAASVLLGVAVTRPVMALIFAAVGINEVQPERVFGVAFWIGFGSSALAGEWYLRRGPQPRAIS